MTNETTQPEQAAAVGESVCSAWIDANYSEGKVADECNTCKHVEQTQDATQWEAENLQEGYGGVFCCRKFNRIVNAGGHCDGFRYFDD